MPVLVLLILKAYFNSVVTFLVSLEYRLSYPSLHPALFILSSHSVRKLAGEAMLLSGSFGIKLSGREGWTPSWKQCTTD